ncbi:MAG: biopolymer transporter ExbD [Verrucomicrobia bacterium]|nr:biopolymer transporter ExbD [Verrucomicrobiota bacterium]
MRFAVKKRRQPPAVIIVSLIDILIVLLIFLMVTTTFKDTPALRITLPESAQAASKPGVSENPPLIITITTNRPTFYVGKTPVTLERLQAELMAKAQANPNLTVAIRADTEAAYGNVVKVTEAATLARVKEIKAFLKPAIKP